MSQWLNIDKSTGTGNGTVKLTIAENKGYTARRATVTATSGKSTARMAVTQEPAYYIDIEHPSSGWTIPASEGTVDMDGLEWDTTYVWFGILAMNVTVPFITKAEIGIDGKDWVEVPVTNNPSDTNPETVKFSKILPERDGMHRCTLRLTVEENNAEKDRQALVLLVDSKTGDESMKGAEIQVGNLLTQSGGGNRRVAELYFEKGKECIQCGTCSDLIDMCLVQAISLDSGSLEIDQDRCTGCGQCVEYGLQSECPVGAVIRMTTIKE